MYLLKTFKKQQIYMFMFLAVISVKREIKLEIRDLKTSRITFDFHMC